MRFRVAQKSDIDCIMRIVEDARASLASLGVDQWQQQYPDRGVFESDCAHGNSYVLEDEDGKVVGTIMVGFDGEPGYDAIEGGPWLTSGSSKSPCYGVVHRIAADKTGKGIGYQLLEGAENLARQGGYQSVRIDTHPNNLPMTKLLNKRGYKPCGTIYLDPIQGGASPERTAYEKLL